MSVIYRCKDGYGRWREDCPTHADDGWCAALCKAPYTCSHRAPREGLCRACGEAKALQNWIAPEERR